MTISMHFYSIKIRLTGGLEAGPKIESAIFWEIRIKIISMRRAEFRICRRQVKLMNNFGVGDFLM